MIFAQHHWYRWIDDPEKRAKNSIDPLLSLKVPPKLIHFFADNPSIQTKRDGVMNILNRKYDENGNSWSFLTEYLNKEDLSWQIKIEERINAYIQANYDNDVVRYYQYMYKMMVDREKGNLQIVGS